MAETEQTQKLQKKGDFQVHCHDVHIGLDKKNICEIGDRISKIASNEALLLLKVDNYESNVVGDKFFSLKLLFRQHAEEIEKAYDCLKVLLRGLGVRVPNITEILKLVSLELPKEGEWLDQYEMVKAELSDQEAMLRCLFSLYHELCDNLKDPVIADSILQLSRVHRHQAFQLRSIVVQPKHHERGAEKTKGIEETAGLTAGRKEERGMMEGSEMRPQIGLAK